MKTRRFLIIGTGAWGTALAQVLTDNKQEVFLYGKNKEELKDLANCKNSKFFGDLDLNILSSRVLNSLSFALKKFLPDIIILAVPTNVMETVVNELHSELLQLDITEKERNNIILLNVAKGFAESGKSMYTLIKGVFPKNSVISLLGPSHAEEVILRKLTFVNIVDPLDNEGYVISNLFNNFYFKTEVINDIAGAELGTSMKNAMALMSGIFEGLGFGDNARAALCTKALNEMLLLSEKVLDVEKITLLGYCGLGDLIVTCYSRNSRNFIAGEQIGKLNSFASFEKDNTKTVEGIRTVKYIYNLAEKHNLHLPIINCLYNIIYKNICPIYAVDNLINKQEGLFD